MSISFYTATQGVMKMQEALDITANNVANVSTNGFKPLRASFSDLIYTVRNDKSKDVEVGHGVKIDKTDLMYDIGSMSNTERQLDFATPTEGLFAFQRADGQTVYSKNGAFSISDINGQWTLVDAKGSKVLDYTGKPITVTKDEKDNIDTNAVLNSIGVYKFSNPYGLKADGDNYYLATASSGAAAADQNLEKRSGFLEASSSNIADQMVKIIQYQRAFSFNTKMVQTADDIENIVNNLR